MASLSENTLQLHWLAAKATFKSYKNIVLLFLNIEMMMKTGAQVVLGEGIFLNAFVSLHFQEFLLLSSSLISIFGERYSKSSCIPAVTSDSG